MSAAAGLVSRWSRGSIRVFVALVLAASNSKAQVVPPPPASSGFGHGRSRRGLRGKRCLYT